jgi:2-hydroxychromene-2-carboxylate isomerase
MRWANPHEVEERARRYGLPRIAWPASWPADGLAAMRAATWAKQQGLVEEFVRAVFQARFENGADIAEPAVLTACATRAALDATSLEFAIADPEIKDTLRIATRSAWSAGVSGVPSLRVGATVFYGDDQLELAGEHLGK